MREINSDGLALLKLFEGCRLNAYLDVGGVPTVAYGHTGPEVVLGMIYTQQQADDQLKKDLEPLYQLDHYLADCVNDNQYSALICLAYNIGMGAVKKSGIISNMNAGYDPDNLWRKYDHVKGVEIPGLKKRREAELKLFHALG